MTLPPLVQDAYEKLWQQSLHGLIEAGIPEKRARMFVGWGLKKGHSIQKIRLAIGAMKLKPPPRAEDQWRWWQQLMK